ncbi:hypothetical protein GIB67_009945, partial [Kingdonia uniflora]
MAEGPNATDPAQVLAQQVGGPSANPRPLNTRTRLDQLEDKMQALSRIIDQVTTLEERLDGFSDDQAHMGERLVTLEGVVEGNMATLLDQVAELSSKVNLLVKVVGNGEPAPLGGDRPRIKVPEPKAYEGARDAKEVENFLFDMETYFNVVRPDS